VRFYYGVNGKSHAAPPWMSKFDYGPTHPQSGQKTAGQSDPIPSTAVAYYAKSFQTSHQESNQWKNGNSSCPKRKKCSLARFDSRKLGRVKSTRGISRPSPPILHSDCKLGKKNKKTLAPYVFDGETQTPKDSSSGSCASAIRGLLPSGRPTIPLSTAVCLSRFSTTFSGSNKGGQMTSNKRV